MPGGPATRPKTPLAVENSVGKLVAPEMRRLTPARERELEPERTRGPGKARENLPNVGGRSNKIPLTCERNAT
jgi:hypothetical protein